MKPMLLAALSFSIAVVAAAQNSSPSQTRTAVLAGGCFWCIQPAFDKTPGVIKTVVGYCGGTEPNPTYKLVTSEKTKYRESIEITYDPAKVSYDQLLDIYWRQIDPTQADGQFTDIGPSYRAAIFYGNAEEKKIAEASKEKLTRSGKFKKTDCDRNFACDEILARRRLSPEILPGEPGSFRSFRRRLRPRVIQERQVGRRTIVQVCLFDTRPHLIPDAVMLSEAKHLCLFPFVGRSRFDPDSSPATAGSE